MKYNKEKALLSTEEHLYFWINKPGSTVSKGCLSQWYGAKFKEGRITFHNCEQYMMYHKAILFQDNIIANKILGTIDAKEIKALGRQVRNFDETTWDLHKVRIVKQGNLLKFSQNEKLSVYLLDTGNRILIEASPYDKIWGVGLKETDLLIQNPDTWKGENLLGFILMEVRDELRRS